MAKQKQQEQPATADEQIQQALITELKNFNLLLSTIAEALPQMTTETKVLNSIWKNKLKEVALIDDIRNSFTRRTLSKELKRRQWDRSVLRPNAPVVPEIKISPLLFPIPEGDPTCDLLYDIKGNRELLLFFLKEIHFAISGLSSINKVIFYPDDPYDHVLEKLRADDRAKAIADQVNGMSNTENSRTKTAAQRKYFQNKKKY